MDCLDLYQFFFFFFYLSVRVSCQCAPLLQHIAHAFGLFRSVSFSCWLAPCNLVPRSVYFHEDEPCAPCRVVPPPRRAVCPRAVYFHHPQKSRVPESPCRGVCVCARV
eukprot:NODE_4587_length_568_cov_108.967245_g3337_i0.p2 GENE.NODE_4587_length_568_cov_108.967245_g3337_i0~~NODE_4587_length_568_cov_108.967245_g3337_i0.p2  ORF type:complete len:108 (+),score=13.28 NODE_4587_length_568_cov_108.967245_g3337_i0:86-409(+)